MSSRLPLVLLVVVAVVLALVVAVSFDSPTSVFLLAGIAAVAALVGTGMSRKR